MPPSVQLPPTQLKRVSETNDQIENEKIALAKQRQDRLDRERREANIKYAIGIVGSLGATALSLYLGRQKLTQQQAILAEKEADRLLAYTRLEKEERKRLNEIELLETEARTTREKWEAKSKSDKKSNISTGLVTGLAATKLLERVAPSVYNMTPQAFKEWWEKKASETETARERAGFQKQADDIRTATEDVLSMNDLMRQVLRYQFDPKPTSQFPEKIDFLAEGDDDPNKPIGPWKQVTRPVRTSSGKIIDYSYYNFGTVPDTEKRYTTLEKFAHPLINDPTFTVDYKKKQDPEGWYTVSAKPPDTEAFYRNAARTQNVASQIMTSPMAQNIFASVIKSALTK